MTTLTPTLPTFEELMGAGSSERQVLRNEEARLVVAYCGRAYAIHRDDEYNVEDLGPALVWLRKNKHHAADFLLLYPRLCAHIICHSLGYATPTAAAFILANAHRREPNWCEWIDACYERDPLPAVRQAITGRKYHHGYMSDYRRALALVRTQLNTGSAPLLASWF